MKKDLSKLDPNRDIKKVKQDIKEEREAFVKKHGKP